MEASTVASELEHKRPMPPRKPGTPSSMSTVAPASTTATTPTENNTLVYILRKDLRVADNPILNHLSESPDHGFTHLVPLHVLSPTQIEVSGLIPNHPLPGGYGGNVSATEMEVRANTKRTCPYPEARSREGKFWRCGPYRAKFVAESVWTLQQSLMSLGSDLLIRVGHYDEVIESLADALRAQGFNIGAVWMTSEEGTEEKEDEEKVRETCRNIGADAKFWPDEKFFIDDRDITLPSPQDLPDVFTTYRKSMEPLRSRPRPMVPAPRARSLPHFIPHCPPHPLPFVIPETLDGLIEALVRPVREFLPKLVQPTRAGARDPQQESEMHPEVEPPSLPSGSETCHPFIGGETHAHARLSYIIHSGVAGYYKATRNGLLGVDFSTKLSAYLAIGCLTARQVHWALAGFEAGDWDWLKWGQDSGLLAVARHGLDGWRSIGASGGKGYSSIPDPEGKFLNSITETEGYGKGENEGTAAVRFELLWRDYMRLCNRKFGARLFALSGFRKDKKTRWKSILQGRMALQGDAGSVAPSSWPDSNGHSPRSQSNPPTLNRAESVHVTTPRPSFNTLPPPRVGSSPPAGPAYPRRYPPTQSTYLSTFRQPTLPHNPDQQGQEQQPTLHVLHRCLNGTTGQTLIDATSRELLSTGYTSNRARQNFASFLTKHLSIDWRLGAEWYECCLIDYDVSSNWANWQYVGGIGNDPRGEARIFNPVKQGFEYDPLGKYSRAWVPEVRGFPVEDKASAEGKPAGDDKNSGRPAPDKKLENIMQPWTTPREQWRALGWENKSWERMEMWEKPVLKINFRVEGKPGRGRRGFRQHGPARTDRRSPGRGRGTGSAGSYRGGAGSGPRPGAAGSAGGAAGSGASLGGGLSKGAGYRSFGSYGRGGRGGGSSNSSGGGTSPTGSTGRVPEGPRRWNPPGAQPPPGAIQPPQQEAEWAWTRGGGGVGGSYQRGGGAGGFVRNLRGRYEAEGPSASIPLGLGPGLRPSSNAGGFGRGGFVGQYPGGNTRGSGGAMRPGGAGSGHQGQSAAPSGTLGSFRAGRGGNWRW